VPRCWSGDWRLRSENFSKPIWVRGSVPPALPTFPVLAMIVRVRSNSARWFTATVRAVQRVTLAAGICLLAWPMLVSAESVWAQWAAGHELAQAKFAGRETIVPGKAGAVASAGTPPRGSALARFEIPRLKLAYPLLEGTDNGTLDKSIGHVEGTGLPGDTGNIGIAGHRNTHFRKLEWVRRGDEIVLTSAKGRFRYYVEWARLFTPTDIEVLDRNHGPAVTLVTCFPFEYVGAAPLRYIIRALPDADTRARLNPVAPSSAKGD
jgi:sortase A